MLYTAEPIWGRVLTEKLPASILFMCYLNAIRSPMAEGLMKSRHGQSIYIQSCGLVTGEQDSLMVKVMAEKNIDMSLHVSRTIDELTESNYDLVIAFTREAGQVAQVFFSDKDSKIEIWPVADPTLGALDGRTLLNNYRAVRDTIAHRLQQRFK